MCHTQTHLYSLSLSCGKQCWVFLKTVALASTDNDNKKFQYLKKKARPFWFLASTIGFFLWRFFNEVFSSSFLGYSCSCAV